MQAAPDAAIAQMAAHLAEGTRHLADAFAALGHDGSPSATDAASEAARTQSRLEKVYRRRDVGARRG